MNKSEIREVTKLAIMHKLGMIDAVARGLSALVRSARTTKSRVALMDYAHTFAVATHPEFII